MQLPLDLHDSPASAVHARLARAKRRSAWLWPEIPVAEWRQALISIEGIASAVLTRARSLRRLEGPPAALGLACYTSGMGPLLGWWHAQGRFEASEEIAGLLTLHLEHNRLRSGRMREGASATLHTFARNGIRSAVLKGADTAERYFPAPATRPASDIDLLVAPCQVADAEHVLRAAGYRLVKRSSRESDWRRSDVADQPRSLLLVHAEDPWSIDLHVSLDIEMAAGLGVLRLDEANPLDAIEASRSGSGHGLSQPLLLLHLAAHASTGLHNLTVLRLVELRLVIERDEARRELDWDAFTRLCRQLNALGAVWPALKLVENLASGTVPQGVLHECSAAAPGRLRAVVEALTPATAQRVGGTSIEEHFMWSNEPWDVLRQLAADLLPGRSWHDVRAVYARRFWQVARAAIRR